MARARRAAGLYLSGRAARIVMSGAYGVRHDLPPKRAEATAMTEIAVAAGVPPGSITAETRSRDTNPRQHLVHQAAAGRARRAGRHRGDLGLARGARALPGASDLGTRLPGGCGAAGR